MRPELKVLIAFFLAGGRVPNERRTIWHGHQHLMAVRYMVCSEALNDDGAGVIKRQSRLVSDSGNHVCCPSTVPPC